ncbi:MAG: ribonuclease P protein component [Desulfobulbaceae bacterium]|nr:MAG: ribonuclease P protein component [Desulfobulbaceae bacterium]
MHQFGLPKTCLLRKSEDFDLVYRHGKRLYGPGFSLIYLQMDRDYSRIGISVSRKLKGAVVRNRIKRIFKESFRLNRDLFPVHADIVIAVRPDFALDSPKRITQAVSNLMTAGSIDK